MMIGGGGDGCNRADHGIGNTEAGNARFAKETVMETLEIVVALPVVILSTCGLNSCKMFY